MEVLVRVGDGGNYKDGDVISAKPDGWLLPSIDMKAWIDNGVPPALLADMPQYVSDSLRRAINWARFMLNHTLVEIIAEFEIKGPTQAAQEQDAQERKDAATEQRADLITYGLDTNWGNSTLKQAFALRIDSTDLHNLREFMDQDRPTDHLAVLRRKRRYKVDYTQLYDAAKLAEIADKETWLGVDREIAIAKTVVVSNALT